MRLHASSLNFHDYGVVNTPNRVSGPNSVLRRRPRQPFILGANFRTYLAHDFIFCELIACQLAFQTPNDRGCQSLRSRVRKSRRSQCVEITIFRCFQGNPPFFWGRVFQGFRNGIEAANNPFNNIHFGEPTAFNIVSLSKRRRG